MKRLRSIAITILLTFSLLIALMPCGLGEVNAISYPSNPTIDNSVSTWDCVYFGRYTQEGYQDTTKQKIKWRVLNVTGNDALLLADRNLSVGPVGTREGDITWETSTLRSWLNGYDEAYNSEGKDYELNNFIDYAFSSDEQKSIITTRVINDDSEQYGYEGGNDTNDKVFILSYKEALKTTYGFIDNKSRVANNTNYAYYISRNSDCSRPSNYSNPWWLRTIGSSCSCVSWAAVNYEGEPVPYGWSRDSNFVGIRPVIHIDLSTADWTFAGITCSDGTCYDSSDKGFDPKVDGNSFVHSNNPGGGFEGENNYNSLNDEDRATFFELAKKYGIARNAKKMLHSKWEGSCHGIAISMGLQFNKYISLQDLSSKEKTSYFSIGKPCKDAKFLSKIELYQLSQFLIGEEGRPLGIRKGYRLKNPNLVGGLKKYNVNHYDAESLPAFLETLVNNTRYRSGVFLFTYGSKPYAHSILITGYEYDNSLDAHKLELFDENSVGGDQLPGEKTYMTIPKDYSGFTLKDPFGKVTEDSYTYLQFYDWSDMLAVLDKRAVPNEQQPILTISSQDNVTIKNSNQEVLNYNGDTFTGDMDVFDINYVNANGDSKIVISTNYSDSFKLDAKSDKCDFSVSYGDAFIAVNGDNITDINANIKANSVEIDGDQYSFDATLETENEVAENENGLATISGNSSEAVVVSALGNIVSATSDGIMKNVTATTYVEDNKKTTNLDNTNEVKVNTENCKYTYEIGMNVKYKQTEARKLAQLINANRTSETDSWYWNEDDTEKINCTGLEELKYDKKLEEVAMQRAAEIAISFEHTRPNGKKCFTAYYEKNIESNYMSENIAAGQTSAEAANNAFREDNEMYSSQGHRRNMLSDKANSVGCACVYYNGTYYWVEEFANSEETETANDALDENKDMDVKICIDEDSLVSIAPSINGKKITEMSGVVDDTIAVPDIEVAICLPTTWPQKKCPIIFEAEYDIEDEDIAVLDYDYYDDAYFIKLCKRGNTNYKIKALGQTTTVPINVGTIKLSKENCELEIDKSHFVYCGRPIYPNVDVWEVYRDEGVTCYQGVSEDNYELKYQNNINIGIGKIIVSGANRYEGTLTKSFVINPKNTGIYSPKRVKKAFTAKWKRSSAANCTGYQVRYSRYSSMRSSKTVTVNGYKNTSKKISKLSSKKKYYLQVRCYKTVKGKKYYSAWSSRKTVRTK